MDGGHTTVTTNVQIVAIFSRNHPEIFAARFGTFSCTTTDPALHFVRTPDSLVPIFDPDGKTHGVLDAVPAPRRSDTTLDSPQGFPVRMARFKPGVA